MSSDDYLWDPASPADPEIEALERALRPLRHHGGPPPAQVAPNTTPSRRGRGWWGYAAAAGLLLAAGLWWMSQPTNSSSIELIVEGRQQRLFEAERFIAVGEEHLLLDEYGELTLHQGAELEVQRLVREQARLFLHRGRLDALVYLNAKPRFFQVGTPAARCVDLGCRYTLTVDDAGDAHVEVQTGRVVFENDGREVYVPAQASCRASREHGAATPRFTGCPAELEAAVDAYDAARTSGKGHHVAALRVLQQADLADPKHSLPVWHLLQDEDPAVVEAAQRLLEKHYGKQEIIEGVAPRDVWLDTLSEDWPW